MYIRRQYFSLIELLVVLTLIAAIAGVVAINSQKALYQQHFQSEVTEFADRLRLAQNLMLVADSDVHFVVEANDKGIKYRIETDTPFSPHFDRFIKKEGSLKAIHHVSHAAGKDGIIDLKFLSKGSVMTPGNIQLVSGLKGKEYLFEANIMLHGFPSPIVVTEKKQNEEFASNYDANLTRIMIQEIQMVNYEKNVSP